jgi:hypothetical protein
MRNLSAAFMILAAFAATRAEAGQVYNCEVTQFFKAQVDVGNGPPKSGPDDIPLMRQRPGEGIGDFYVGKRFAVNTANGVILGEIMNVTSPNVERHILDPGTGGNAFKLLEVWGPIRGVRYTTILTYSIGESKPFVMVDDGDILSGQCR